ncbi:MAG: hypothetical protein KAG96_06805 [Ichthyobacteriaceae bacterium]|nr:hypothetical protein [Ichthyobacteriaceae bacterium]
MPKISNSTHNINISQLISYVFHPVFIPIATLMVFLISFESALTVNEKIIISITMLSSTLFLPLLTTLILHKIDYIESFEMKLAEERYLPILTTMIYLFIAAYILNGKKVSFPLVNFLYGVMISMFLIIMLLRKIKVSLHVSAVSSFMGFLVFLSSVYFIHLIPLIVISSIVIGMVASARLILKAHTNIEVISGFIIGFFPQVIILFLG